MTDKQLVAFARSFRFGMLGRKPSSWMCAAVSMPLAGLLSVHGVETTVMESDLGDLNHVWLRLKDGRALDPTADQFNHIFPHYNYPRVYLGEPLDIHGNAKAAALTSSNTSPTTPPQHRTDTPISEHTSGISRPSGSPENTKPDRA